MTTLSRGASRANKTAAPKAGHFALLGGQRSEARDAYVRDPREARKLAELRGWTRYAAATRIKFFFQDFPGAAWSRQELSDALGVSLSTVDKALNALHRWGLLRDEEQDIAPHLRGQKPPRRWVIDPMRSSSSFQGGPEPQFKIFSDPVVISRADEGQHNLKQKLDSYTADQTAIRARSAISHSALCEKQISGSLNKRARHPVAIPQDVLDLIEKRHGWVGLGAVLEILREGDCHRYAAASLEAARKLPWRAAKSPGKLFRKLFRLAREHELDDLDDAEVARTRACEAVALSEEFAFARDLDALDDQALVAHWLDLDARVGVGTNPRKLALIDAEHRRTSEAIAQRPSARMLRLARTTAPPRRRYVPPPKRLEDLDDEALARELDDARHVIEAPLDFWEHRIAELATAKLADERRKRTRLAAATDFKCLSDLQPEASEADAEWEWDLVGRDLE